MQGEIWRRSGQLVAYLLGEVFEAEEGGVRLPDLLAQAGALSRAKNQGTWSEKTVDNTIGDLCAFGVIRKVRVQRDVWLRPTVLGLAWFERLDAQLPSMGDVVELERVCGCLWRGEDPDASCDACGGAGGYLVEVSPGDWVRHGRCRACGRGRAKVDSGVD